MSKLLDRIRFLAANPDVYIQSFDAHEAQEFLAEFELADAPPCEAVLRHGPGHQSRTRCRVKGPHKVHETVYGGNTFATWTGDEAMTGFFDEPPEEDEDE